jgi:hypothetical protein
MQQLDKALLALEQDGNIIRMAQGYGSVDLPHATGSGSNNGATSGNDL